MTVLPVTARLTHELAFRFCGPRDCLAVAHLRLADVCLNSELAEHSVHDDFEVKLAHTRDDNLPRILVGVRLEGGVLFLQFEDGGVHTFLTCLGLGLDCHLDDRLGEHHIFQHYLVRLVAERVARGALFEPDKSNYVARARFRQVLPVVRVHTQDSADAFVLVLAGIEHHHTRLYRAAVNADEGEFADIFVRQDFEHQRGERLVVAGMAHFLSVHSGVLARDGRDIGGRGQKFDDGVEQTLYALVAVGTAAQHGRHTHFNRPLSDCLFELLFRDGFALVHDALLEDGVVEVRRLFHKFPAGCRRRFRHIRGDVLHGDGDAVVGRGIVAGFHRNEVDDAFELAFLTDGQHDGHRIGAQPFVHHLDYVVKVRSVDVHFVDERDARHLVGVGLTPHVFGLGFDAAFGAEHRDRSVQHSQAAFDLNGKVDVAGSVDDVNLMTLPHGGSGGGGDGYPPFALLHHVIHNRCAVVHLAELARHARIEQNALGGRGFSGVDVSHDADVPDLVKCKVALHKDYHL